MAAEGSAVKRFDADFKKIPGTLSITGSAIAWVPKTNGAMDRQSQALSRAMGTCPVSTSYEPSSMCIMNEQMSFLERVQAQTSKNVS